MRTSALTEALGLGFAVALPALACIGGGLWLDRRFGSMPFWTICGVLLSLGISIALLMHILRAERPSDSA